MHSPDILVPFALCVRVWVTQRQAATGEFEQSKSERKINRTVLPIAVCAVESRLCSALWVLCEARGEAHSEARSETHTQHSFAEFAGPHYAVCTSVSVQSLLSEPRNVLNSFVYEVHCVEPTVWNPNFSIKATIWERQFLKVARLSSSHSEASLVIEFFRRERTSLELLESDIQRSNLIVAYMSP